MDKNGLKNFGISVVIGLAVSFACAIILKVIGINEATKFVFFSLSAWAFLISAGAIYTFLYLKKSRS